MVLEVAPVLAQSQKGLAAELYQPAPLVGTDSPAAISAEYIVVFQRIADQHVPFISRGDDSGTHAKELSIWKKAGIEPQGDWYFSTGLGMSEVLTMIGKTEFGQSQFTPDSQAWRER